MRFISALLLVLFSATGCSAGEADIRKNIEARFPGAKVDSVSRTPVRGLFEVVVDGNQILYSDAKGDHVIVGELLDTRTRANLTQARMEKLMEVKLDSLPLEQAIKQVKGDGSRRMAVFSDPDCTFCRRVQFELDRLDNVTIYMFPFPLPMHPDATRKSILVWCSEDRSRAWDDLMLRNKEPVHGRTDCANPIAANLELGQRLNINGTPALIFADGKRVPGFIPAARIEQMLAAAAKPAAK